MSNKEHDMEELDNLEDLDNEIGMSWFRENLKLMAFAPALAALLGSLYFSEIAHFIPCTLCWYQRILMYPLAAIILIGILRDDRWLPSYVLPFSILGMAVSGYHYLLQQGVVGKTTFCQTGIPCSAKYINWGGFITIPMLAFIAFTLITVFMALDLRQRLKDR